jgi:hypothetical protein
MFETEQAVERTFKSDDQFFAVDTDFQPGLAVDVGWGRVDDCYAQPEK